MVLFSYRAGVTLLLGAAVPLLGCSESAGRDVAPPASDASADVGIADRDARIGDATDAGEVTDADSPETNPLTDTHWPPGAPSNPLPSRTRCDDGSLAPGDYDATEAIDGGTRTWHVHVPKGYAATSPEPLLLAFHGGGQNAAGFEAMSTLRAKADAAGFTLVEPEGAPALNGQSASFPFESWNAGNCCAAAVTDEVDDVAFVKDILSTLAKDVCFDASRVYATGFSNGAMFTYRLACALSDQIAAIAPVSGGSGQYDQMSGAELYACEPTRPVPILHIHVTGDTCYPYDGGLGALSGVDFEPVPKTIATWRARNGCDADASVGQASTQGQARCEAYDCPSAGPITLCTIPGGGHYWPGGNPWLGSTTLCPNNGALASPPVANDAIWAFLSSHSLP